MNTLPNEILLRICSFIPNYRAIRGANTVFYNIIENNVQKLVNRYSPLHHLTKNIALRAALLSMPLIKSSEIAWEIISRGCVLTESFIRIFADHVDWHCISYKQTLSESFIREFADRVDWECISQYQKLTEPFIRAFAHRVNWRSIVVYQKLSESFVEEFIDRVNWPFIDHHQIQNSHQVFKAIHFNSKMFID